MNLDGLVGSVEFGLIRFEIPRLQNRFKGFDVWF
jgi:hypothetical protein